MKKFILGVVIGTQLGPYVNPYILKYVLNPLSVRLGIKDVERFANENGTS